MKDTSIPIHPQNICKITFSKTPEPSVMKSFTNQEIRSEWEIIQQAQTNPRAFRPLYERYYEAIFRFIYNRTTDESLTADLTAQVFLKALNQLPKYTFKGVPFSAWLYRIASNEVNQYYRKSSKNRVVSLQDHHVQLLTGDTNDDDFERRRNIMLTVLSSLKEKDLLLIELRFFEEHSFESISQILGISTNNAKVKVHRIIKRMQQKVQALYQ